MLLFAWFAACHVQVRDDVMMDDLIADTGPHGVGSCVEASREAVTDPSVATPDFTFAEGSWAASLVDVAGQVSWADGTTSPASVSIVDQGPANVVSYSFVAEDGPMPTTNGDCPDRYETTADVAVDAGGDLNATFTATITTLSLSGGEFSARSPLGSVAGTRRPTSFDPSSFSKNWLGLDATRDGKAWSGALGWYAANDTSGDTGVDPAIGEAAGQFGGGPMMFAWLLVACIDRSGPVSDKPPNPTSRPPDQGFDSGGRFDSGVRFDSGIPTQEDACALASTGAPDSAWLATATAPASGSVSWSNGETGAATLTFVATSAGRKQVYTHDPNGSVPLTDGDCPDMFSLDVNATLKAGDHGELDETFATSIVGLGTALAAHGVVPLAAITGTLRPTAIDTDAFPGTWLDVGLALPNGAWSGALEWMGSSDDPPDTAEPQTAELAGQLTVTP